MAFDAKRFFADPKVAFSNDRLAITVGFFLGTILMGVFNNYPQYASQANVFFILLIVWGFAAAIEASSKAGDRFIAVIGVGKAPLVPLIVGCVVGGALVLVSQSVVSLPQSVVAVRAGFTLFFVVVAAPFVEASFFRGLLMPAINQSLLDYLKVDALLAGILAIVLQAGVFSWYHWFVLGGALSALQVTFVFGLLMGVGVYFFRSVAFEYGAHGVNNLLVFLK